MVVALEEGLVGVLEAILHVPLVGQEQAPGEEEVFGEGLMKELVVLLMVALGEVLREVLD